MSFECQRCGWCCKNLVISISYSDIIRWLNEGYFNILREVSYIDNYPRKNTGGFYFSKTTFNPKQYCPFLRIKDNLSFCSIYETRPMCCKDFPSNYKSKCISCKNYKFNKKDYNKIKKYQYEEYKKTFLKRKYLLDLLIKTRGID